MERSGPWWQFSISVQSVFRAGSPSRLRRGLHSLWVPDRDLSCGCPALHVGRTFLLIGAEEGERGWGPEESRLVADRSTLALQWREHWSPKLRGFRGQDKRGRCPAGGPADGHRRQRTKPQPGYIPPHLLAEKDQTESEREAVGPTHGDTQLEVTSSEATGPASTPALGETTPGPGFMIGTVGAAGSSS